MDFKTAVEIIDRIEDNVDVTQISYRNRLIWPILKYKLFFGLLEFGRNKNTNELKQLNNDSANETKEYNPSLVKKILFHINTSSAILFCYVVNALRRIVFSFRIRNSEVLILDVSDVEYVDLLNNKKYSRYISPYVEFFNKYYSTMFVNASSNKTNIQKEISPYDFNFKEELRQNKRTLYYNKRFNSAAYKIENLNEILLHLIDKPYHRILHVNNLIDELDECIAYEEFWLKILRRSKIKGIFFECHYGNWNYYGITSAAAKVAIPTVDIQHGISQDYMYKGWRNSPKNGYDFLPDYYWCWSQHDVDSINKSKFNSVDLKPFLGGNMWFAKSKINIKMPSDKLQRVINSYSPQKVLLVTLQHSMPISDMLIQAIRQSDIKWLWLVRFHPLDYVDAGFREGYKKTLKEFKNVEWEVATEANLYELFQIMDVHLTHHSTSAVEAISFKKPTILLGSKFKFAFMDYINSGWFFIAENAHEIIQLASKYVLIEEGIEKNFQMEVAENTTRDNINKILDQCAA